MRRKIYYELGTRGFFKPRIDAKLASIRGWETHVTDLLQTAQGDPSTQVFLGGSIGIFLLKICV